MKERVLVSVTRGFERSIFEMGRCVWLFGMVFLFTGKQRRWADVCFSLIREGRWKGTERREGPRKKQKENLYRNFFLPLSSLLILPLAPSKSAARYAKLRLAHDLAAMEKSLTKRLTHCDETIAPTPNHMLQPHRQTVAISIY